MIEFQKAVLDQNNTTSQLLQWAKAIAYKLDLPNILEWINKEITGYENPKDLPSYRLIMGGVLKARNPMLGWIHVNYIKEGIPVGASIPEIEGYDEKELSFQVVNKVPIQDPYGESRLLMRWQQAVFIASPQVTAIISQVRDALLTWALELERNGITGAGMEFKPEEKIMAKNQTFTLQNCIVQGSIGGGKTTHNQTNSDLKILQMELQKSGVSEEDALELEELVRNYSTKKDSSSLGKIEGLLEKYKGVVGVAGEIIKGIITTG